MSAAAWFYAPFAVMGLIMLGSIARNVSEIADMLHDDREARRRG